MPIKHRKAFGIYHWDTFDNETDLLHETDTLVEASQWVQDKYRNRICGHGADRVDIVDQRGNIVKKFRVS